MISIGNNPHEEKEVSLLSPGCMELALDAEEINRILEIVKGIELGDATVDGENNSEIRSCKVGWIPYEDETAWVYGRLYELGLLANEKLWGFDPVDMVEHIMYCEYHEGDHFDWHVDMGSPPPFNARKIAVSVQLSESDDYRGGNLFFMSGGLHTVSRGKGSVIAYPTYIMHSVEKVTAGVRKSLVFWLGGKPFK
jgi:PKHD-type hydroxylase